MRLPSASGKRGEPLLTPEHFGQVIAVVHARAPCDLVGGQVDLKQKTAGERATDIPVPSYQSPAVVSGAAGCAGSCP